jgi:hypothetical protein
MRTKLLLSAFLTATVAVLLISCAGEVNLTAWKNPANNAQISKIAILPLFEKLEYMKPFEKSIKDYFNGHGLAAVGSLEFLDPTIKYNLNDVKHKCDSLGVDAILIFLYQGTDKSESYVPPTTYYSGNYGAYGGYWGGGYWGGYYGGYYGGYTTTGGYWTTTATINLSAKVYVKGSTDALWTGEITVTDPEYVDQAAFSIAKQVYASFKEAKILK